MTWKEGRRGGDIIMDDIDMVQDADEEGDEEEEKKEEDKGDAE